MLVVAPVFQLRIPGHIVCYLEACHASATGILNREKFSGLAVGAKQNPTPLQTVTIAFFVF
ncbi:MAG: hypothetical protein KA135_10000 [Halioglobus sp.]|nr:hypothetical protein [Halioglobus sp.]